MKKVKNLSKKIERTFKESEVMILLEHMNDNIKIIAENLSGFRDEMYGFRDEMYGFRDEVYAFRAEMYNFRDETRENFAFVAKQLSRIEDEIEQIKTQLTEKADKKWVLKQIDLLQKQIDELRVAAKKI